MEGITETRFLSLLCGQSFDWLQVEVIVKMQIVKILSMDQQIQHVVALADDLEAGFNPIKLS
jgi:hypothetical protein